MGTIEMRCGCESHEELGAIGVGARIRHREGTTATMLLNEIFITELRAIDGLSSNSTTVSEVTTLGHEAWDNAMEGRILEVKWLTRQAFAHLTRAQSPEILRCLRSRSVQVHDNATACARLTTDANVHEDARVSSNSTRGCLASAEQISHISFKYN